MISYKICYNLYLVVLLVASLLGASRFRRSDSGVKVITVLLWLTLLGELAAEFARIRYHNNLKVYLAIDVMQLSLTIAYFYYSVGVLRNRVFAASLSLVGAVALAVNLSFYRGLGFELHNLMFLQGIITICLVLFAFARLIIEEPRPDLTGNPHFWIGNVLVFYWCVSFCNWTLMDYYTVTDRNSDDLLSIVLILCILSYGALGIIIRLLPRKRPAL